MRNTAKRKQAFVLGPLELPWGPLSFLSTTWMVGPVPGVFHALQLDAWVLGECWGEN